VQRLHRSVLAERPAGRSADQHQQVTGKIDNSGRASLKAREVVQRPLGPTGPGSLYFNAQSCL
jgi:hypothetical protein